MMMINTIRSSRTRQQTAFIDSGIYILASLFFLSFLNFIATATTTDKDTSGSSYSIVRAIADNASNDTVVPNNCSCYDSTAKNDCCQRVIRHFHKMGTMLTVEVFGRNDGIGQNRSLSFSDHGRLSEPPPNQDYRDVLIVRNLYKALVSGYLYHKVGHECWLGLGNEVLNPSQQNYFIINNYQRWEHVLKASKNERMRIHQLNPPNNQSSLCGYLGQVSEEYGMCVFIVFYFAYYFGVLLANYEYANTLEDRNRTLFLCYEDLVNATTQGAIKQQAYGFLYPGDNIRRKLRQRQQLLEGHSTDHNPELRARLRNMIKQHDAEYFDHIVAWAQSLFKCGDEN